MGGDGARAMLAMRDAGAYNIAQDEASSVVFGMPREAIRLGAVHQVLPVKAIGAHLMDVLRRTGGAPVKPAGTTPADRTGNPSPATSA